MGHYILAISQKPTLSRATLVDHKGKVVISAEYPLKQIELKTGWSEYRPNDILLSQLNAIKTLFRKIGSRKKQIIAVGISSQPATIILWNKTTGKPLGNAVAFQDPRGSDICYSKTDHKDTIRERTGLPLSPYYSASKIKWLLDNTKSAYKLIEKGQLLCGTVNTYLMWHLSNGTIFATDHTNAAQTLLFNIFTKSWDKELLELFEIPHEILPPIFPTSSYIGEVAIEGQAIPVHASTLEHQAALLGNGCLHEGDINVNLDNDGYMLVNTGKKIFMLPGLLTSVSWSSDISTSYLLEGTIHGASSIFDWMKNGLGIITAKDDIENHCRLSKERLFMIPALSGISSPQWNSSITSSIFGLKSSSKREDIVRSAVESIGFIVKDNFNIMEKDGRILLRKIRVNGGISNLSYLLQFQSDLLNLPLYKSANEDPVSVGVSFLAGLNLKMWPSLSSIDKLVSTKKPFTPKQTEDEVKALYERWKLTCNCTKEWSRNF